MILHLLFIPTSNAITEPSPKPSPNQHQSLSFFFNIAQTIILVFYHWFFVSFSANVIDMPQVDWPSGPLYDPRYTHNLYSFFSKRLIILLFFFRSLKIVPRIYQIIYLHFIKNIVEIYDDIDTLAHIWYRIFWDPLWGLKLFCAALLAIGSFFFFFVWRFYETSWNLLLVWLIESSMSLYWL